MHPALKNIGAVIIGLVVGNIINMGIIKFGPILIPPPEGVNPEDIVDIKANIHLYTPLQMMVPFLAHALGTLTAVIVACSIAVSRHLLLALIIGGVFLIGGIMVNYMIGGPMWFTILDLVVAYIPMALLGKKLSKN